MKCISCFIIMACLMTGLNVHAQNFKRCYTVEAMQHREKLQPGYKAAVNATFERAKAHALATQNQRSAVKLRIPVVVHVLFKNAAENLSDSIIHSQIRILNEDYNRLNDDTMLTRSVFDTLAGSADIAFYLAKIDPDGNPTTGITRTATTSGFDPLFNMDYIKFDSLGGKDAWPSDRYLNLWVGDLSFFGIQAVMGYAYPPANAPNWPQGQIPSSPEVEGVVIHYAAFGRRNPNAIGPLSIVNRGRSCTHEVGHYLGLRHIWGDGPCADDDGINDTPHAADNAQQSCTFKNTCTDTPFDYPDMIENFMDYAADSCMNMFTKGQIDFIRSMVLTERPGLLWNADTTVIDTTDTTTTAILDFRGNQDEPDIRIYPNPASDEFALNVNLKSNGEMTVEIFTTVGKLVKKYHSEGSINTHVSMAGEPAGLYILKVTAEGETWNRKVIMQ